MYNVLGTVVYLAMSADATCRGLRSPRDGPLVMEFTKGKSCALMEGLWPSWLSAHLLTLLQKVSL